MCVSHFLCICLLRYGGTFHSHYLPKVPGTQWMPKACLFSEWMKTVRIMNEKHPDSYIWWGTNKGSNAEWRWRLVRAADSLSGGREVLLWERVSASTALTTSSDPETLARNYMTSPQKLQRQVSFCLRVSHRILSIMPFVFRSLLDPTFLILCYSPCPTVCPWTWDVFFIICFHVLRLQQISLHWSVVAPLGNQSPHLLRTFPVFKLTFICTENFLGPR